MVIQYGQPRWSCLQPMMEPAFLTSLLSRLASPAPMLLQDQLLQHLHHMGCEGNWSEVLEVR